MNMSWKELIDRTTIANVVSGACVISGVIYFAVTRNTDGMLFLVGAAVGYLFKTAT